MRCEEALPLALDEETPPGAWLHVQGCARCREAVDDVRRGKAAADEGGWLPPQALEDDVVRRVAADAGTGSVRRFPMGSASRPRRIVGSLVASLVAVIAVVAAVVAVSGESAVHRITLTATDAAPGSSGTVTVTEDGASLHVVVETSGVPAQPMEMWVRTSDGSRVPAASLTSSGQATFRMTMDWADWKGCGVDAGGRTVLQAAAYGTDPYRR